MGSPVGLALSSLTGLSLVVIECLQLDFFLPLLSSLIQFLVRRAHAAFSGFGSESALWEVNFRNKCQRAYYKAKDKGRG